MNNETVAADAPLALNGNGAGVGIRGSKMKERSRLQTCGWSTHCSPAWIQPFGNKVTFLIVFSLTCILQGTFRTYFVAVITTIEKLFELPSQTTGLLLSATEIGQVSSALILPYYAGQGHRPRWMGIGAGLFAIAVLFCASPHWIQPPPPPPAAATTGTALLNKTDDFASVCLALAGTESATECDQQGAGTGGNYIIFAILFLSLLSVGLGQTAVNLLGIPYLDDNVENRNSPVYFAITIGVRIMGPVAGFILGALCTRLYIDPLSPPPNMTPRDPRWLGAWWLGMVIIAVLLLITSFLLYAFPAQLKPTVVVQPKPKIRHFPQTLRRLLVNKILLLRTLSSVFHLLPIAGLYTFLPKYFESQYRMPAHEANLYTGVSGIAVMGIGIFASGFLIRNRSARTIAGWIALVAGVYAAGMLLLVFAGGCDGSGSEGGGAAVVGIDQSYPACSSAPCENCTSKYEPVCSPSTFTTFFNPCHAGCNSTSLEGCACVSEGDLERNPCRPPCPGFHLYLAIFMFIVLAHSTSEVGSMLLTLRCVEKRDKAMALGLVQFAIGVLGNVPCAIVYGAVIDKSCEVWAGKSSCGEGGGHCLVYGTKEFRMYFHGLTALLMGIAFIFDLCVFAYANQIQLEEPDQQSTNAAAPVSVEMVPLNPEHQPNNVN